MKILIAEDNADSRVFLERALRGHGYTVESACNGVEALEKARQSPPDLIISDILMPEMDGFELCRCIKTDDQLRMIPFVFYTATYIDQKDENLAMSLGASRFIVKPIELPVLLKIIEEVLQEYEDRRLPVPDSIRAGDEEIVQMHTEALTRKLDKKIMQLEKERTALKEKEKELILSENKYRTLFEGANDAILLIDPDTQQILDCNQKAADMEGYSIEELKTMIIADLHPEEERPLLPEKFKEVSSKGYGTGISGLHHKNRDGTLVPIEVNARMIEIEGDRLNLSVIRDISEREKAEKELKRSEQLLRLFVEHSPAAIAMFDKDMKYIVASRRFLADYDLGDQNIIGRSHYEVFPELPERWREIHRRCLAGAIEKSNEDRFLRADGKMEYVHWEILPWYETHGEIGGIILFSEVVTERKNLEEQLLQAQKMEAVGQLAGGVAHDFNNILSAIVNYVYLIQTKAGENESLKKDLKQVMSLAFKASEITRGLLAFSRKQVIRPAPLNLNNSVRNMNKLLSKFIGEDIQLDTKLTDEEPVIMADSSQIEQIIINLATNARDAMPDGGVLTIETNIVELDAGFTGAHGFGKPGRYALLTVSDSGKGMDEETKKKIFEPFYTTKETGQGTGLGLAIIYGIVKQHDGNITVYSEPGQGTTFKLYFHTTDTDVADRIKTAPVELSGNAETILVAEDEVEVRNSLKMILERAGYSVITAENGEDAVEQFIQNKDKVQLLLLDIIMPKKNGREAYEAIKRLSPQIRVIYTSGYPSRVLSTKGILKEDALYIEKPILPDKLLGMIKIVLQENRND